MSSDKNFLLTLSIILLILFFVFEKYLFLSFSLIFTLIAYTKPNILHLLNYVFLKIGLLIMILVQPIILRFNFYLIFGIISLIMKIFKYDPLMINKRNLKKETFWLDRKPKDENINATKEQF